MATTANLAPGAQSIDALDPFISPPPDPHRQRYSAFNNELFSLYTNGSPAQAKRALEAHLAETERRLQEASQLGTVLLQQRKELGDRLRDVERQAEESELGPELRERLVELEREFNEVGRDTARAFLPKSRVPSGESPEKLGGATVFTSEATASPSKISMPPSRKQRNQAPSRVHDIKLATEISSSLLQQLRDLQAVLAEKDDALRSADAERSRLEIEVEGLNQRLRAMDETEQRYKDENWNLETRLQEYLASTKEQTEREKRVAQSLSAATAEKYALERELEELRLTHAKLSEDHTNFTKYYDAELANLRRNAALAESDRTNLQRKVDDLTSQNQELAKAVSYRLRVEEQSASRDDAGELEDLDLDQDTPEHSPPISPVKGTPRHGQLEAETLKSSLNHAHRLIQNLKNNIHREKTEKIELKRMLQDARDELDQRRNEPGAVASGSRKRRGKEELFKKPSRPDRLGAHRPSKEEIQILDEPDWEDQSGPDTPSKAVAKNPALRLPRPDYSSASETPTDAYQTATDNDDAAFETANERSGTTTETDAFHTGAETLDGDSSDDLTETETVAYSTIRRSRPPPMGDSYMSTASTSGDESSDMDAKTPPQPSNARYRLKINRNGNRRSSRFSIDMGSPPSVKGSPSSFVNNSNSSTPAGAGAGPSLAAELGDFSGESDVDSFENTPNRSFSPMTSPEQAMRRKSAAERSSLARVILPRPDMTDSGSMTEPWAPGSEKQGLLANASSAIGAAAAGVAGFALGKPFEGRENVVESDGARAGAVQSAMEVETPAFSFSDISSQTIEPVEFSAVVAPAPVLSVSAIGTQSSEPVEPVVPEVTLQHLDISNVSSQAVQPVAVKAHHPQLDISSVSSLDVQPVRAQSPALEMSSLAAQAVHPVRAQLPSLEMSSLAAQEVHPVRSPSPSLGMSSMASQEVHPVRSTSPSLGMSSMASQEVQPMESPAPAVASLNYSPFHTQDIEPVEGVPRQQSPIISGLVPLSGERDGEDADVKPEHPHLTMSDIKSWDFQPTTRLPAALAFSGISSQHTQPKEACQPPMGLSAINSLTTEPEERAETPKPSMDFSGISTQYDIQPQVGVEPPNPVLDISTIHEQHVQPEAREVAPKPAMEFSAVSSQHIEPKGVAPVPHLPSTLSVSSVSSLHTEPQEPRPTVKPSMMFSNIDSQHTEPIIPLPAVVLSRSRSPQDIVIAEDDTSQDVSQTSNARPSQDGREPFKPISPNYSSTDRGVGSEAGSDRKQRSLQTETADDGTQTLLSAHEIEKMMKTKPVPAPVIVPSTSSQSVHGFATPSRTNTTSPRRAPNSPGEASPIKSPRRPGSATSMRSRPSTPPPLPPDHKEVIAAATQKSSSSLASGMGPPLMPASAYKHRPQTPSISSRTGVINGQGKDGATPRATFRTRSDVRSEISTPVTRRSSVSSFASELDQRFNIRQPMNDPLDANITDPRMIQAITQTMIGEWLWKYTRRAGSESMSQTRHRRFFWVHPYTRTLYWSEHDPSTAGKAQLKAKSVAIEAIQVVSDENPMPPGLHRKSLVIITPGRTIKFTAPTSQRHETWFNALSYLLLRTGAEREEEENLTSEDVNEFNPSYQRSSSRTTNRSRVSGSSRTTSRTTQRGVSPQHAQHPTLTPRQSGSTHRGSTLSPPPPSGRFSSLSGMFRPSLMGSLSSRRSRSSAQEGDASLYEASTVVHDSAEDLRQVIEQQEREADRLENVRACCDGKHDVGSLSRTSRYSSGRHRHHHSRDGSSSRQSNHRHNSATPTSQLQPTAETEATEPS